MSKTWVRADFDFGIPWKTFVIPLRSVIGQPLHRTLSNIETDLTDEERANFFADEVHQMIELARPLLNFTIVAIRYDVAPISFKVEVISPSFPRVKFGDRPPVELLELCASCGKEIDYDQMLYRETMSGRVVCSRECAGEADKPEVRT